jgi:hypothetical protein
LIGWDFARFQRATKGAQQSTGGCGDHVIKGGRMRLKLGCVYAIVLSDRAVHTESDRLGFAGKIGPADWPLDPLDSDIGYVKWLAHGPLSLIETAI